MNQCGDRRFLSVVLRDKSPFVQGRDDEKNTCRALQPGHMLRGAQSAILPSLILVPVHQNRGEAQYDENGDGDA